MSGSLFDNVRPVIVIKRFNIAKLPAPPMQPKRRGYAREKRIKMQMPFLQYRKNRAPGKMGQVQGTLFHVYAKPYTHRRFE